jgi:hypothetical protein
MEDSTPATRAAVSVGLTALPGSAKAVSTLASTGLLTPTTSSLGLVEMVGRIPSAQPVAIPSAQPVAIPSAQPVAMARASLIPSASRAASWLVQREIRSGPQRAGST